MIVLSPINDGPDQDLTRLVIPRANGTRDPHGVLNVILVKISTGVGNTLLVIKISDLKSGMNHEVKLVSQEVTFIGAKEVKQGLVIRLKVFAMNTAVVGTGVVATAVTVALTGAHMNRDMNVKTITGHPTLGKKTNMTVMKDLIAASPSVHDQLNVD